MWWPTSLPRGRVLTLGTGPPASLLVPRKEDPCVCVHVAPLELASSGRQEARGAAGRSECGCCRRKRGSGHSGISRHTVHHAAP